MKKIFSMICAFALSIGAFAQQSNYAGSSRFLDNWSITLQGGVTTSMNNFYSGHTAMAPNVKVGIIKDINPWLGVELEGRTLIGTGHGHENGICYTNIPNNYNTHVAFDAVNVSLNARFNILNMFVYNGKRKFFEPIIYTGLGYGHSTCSEFNQRNYLTYRAGAELTFNLGKKRAWGVVVNPSVVWNVPNNFKLDKRNGYFEATVGVVYHFKTSNGTHDFTKVKFYNQSEIDLLNTKINDLQELNKSKDETIDALKKLPKEVHDTIYVNINSKSNKFYFEKNSLNLTGDVSELAKELIESGKTCVVTGYASCEGDCKNNMKLAERRAMVLKDALVKAGVPKSKIKVVNGGETDKFSKTSYEPNRVATAE